MERYPQVAKISFSCKFYDLLFKFPFRLVNQQLMYGITKKSEIVHQKLALNLFSIKWCYVTRTPPKKRDILKRENSISDSQLNVLTSSAPTHEFAFNTRTSNGWILDDLFRVLKLLQTI